MRYWKYISILVLIFTWFLISILIVGNSIDYHKNKRINITKHNKGDIQSFKEYLIEERESRVSWITRKEVAAWAATTLYLSIIIFLFGKKTTFQKNRILSLSSFIIFTILIILFIHQQFGQMINSMAAQRAINKYYYLFSIKDSTLAGFDYSMTNDEVIPRTLSDEITSQQNNIRQLNFIQRFFLPTYKIFKGIEKGPDNIKTVEVEEGILYNIIVLVFIFFIFNNFKFFNKSK